MITPQAEVKRLYKKYKSDEKQFYLIEGEHHSEREWEELEYCAQFVKNHINKVIIKRKKSQVPMTESLIFDGGPP